MTHQDDDRLIAELDARYVPTTTGATRLALAEWCQKEVEPAARAEIENVIMDLLNAEKALAALRERARRAEGAEKDYELLRGQTTRELDCKDAELDEMRTRLVEEHEGNSGRVDAVAWEKQCHEAEQECAMAIENVRALRAERDALADGLRAMMRTHGMHAPCHQHSCQDCKAAYVRARSLLAERDGKQANVKE